MILPRFTARTLRLFSFVATTARAQLGTATISGHVTDPSGATVAAATVVALNAANGFRRQTTSSQLGQYSQEIGVKDAQDAHTQLFLRSCMAPTGLTFENGQKFVLRKCGEVGARRREFGDK